MARLVADLKGERLIRSPAVEAAFMAADRGKFVGRLSGEAVYADAPQAIGHEQTISAPHMVAIMVEALQAAPGMKVLEVGGGSGWHAAVIAGLVRPGGRVVSMERIEPLAAFARANLAAAGFADTVTVVAGDGTRGYAAQAPFDRISVAAAAPHVPAALLDQLNPDGGLLLVPVGPLGRQQLIEVRMERGTAHRSDLGGCVFVPLVGEDGYAPSR
jgi:protein-L-isoaspartate(D-aspartate) O-methyltransferase